MPSDLERASSEAKLLETLKAAVSNKPDIAALASAALEAWGGIEGLVRFGRQMCEDPETTNHNKVQIWKDTVALVKDTHKLEPPTDDARALEDIDLEAAIHGLLREREFTVQDDGTAGGSPDLLIDPDQPGS
jgi:hypothetical protein